MSSWLCAQVLVDEWVGLGITEAVLAPGSRSAPLAAALYEADKAGRLRLHVRIDERSAGFLALGLAKASGRVVPVVTTSGTAAANLLPAVMEACHSGVPLLAVSADRPATLVGTGANQTTDQVGLFGAFPRAQGRVSSVANEPRAWRATVRRVVVAALGSLSRDAGPAHLNVEFTEPLTRDDSQPDERVGFAVAPIGVPRPVALPPEPRTVIVAGDLDPAAGVELAAAAQRASIPLLAEPSSNARSGGAAIALYRPLLPYLAEEVERILVFGHPTLSRPVSALLRRVDAEVIVVSPGARWVDPGWAVQQVVPAVELPSSDPAWLARWKAADALLAERLGKVAEAAGDGLTVGHFDGRVVAAAVVASLGVDDVLVFGSSNPIRDADLAPISSTPPRAYANRGLAGIDGVLSTASGIALATGAPTTALVGDLTALHDIGGLLVPPGEPVPDLRVVVADDNGGSIFATLEYGAPEYAESFERVFATPHGLDVGALARGYGLSVTEVADLEALRSVLATPPRGRELVVVRIDRSGRREAVGTLAEAARAVVEDLP